MKKIIFSLITVVFVLLQSFAVNTYASQTQMPALTSKSSILMEASTGQILYENNAEEAMPPASVTKIMTLLLIFEAQKEGKFQWDDMITVSEYAASMGGSQVFLEPGEMQTVGTLLKCISVARAKDACVTMSECICGNEQEFVKQL